MPHEQILEALSREATQAASTVQEAASRYWSSIEQDPRLPGKPYSKTFRKTAFRVHGDTTRGVEFTGGSRRVNPSRGRTRR